jgi:hypothetical protein
MNLNDIKGWHDCCQEWRVHENRDSEIYLPDLIPLLETRKTIAIDHKDIAWWCMDTPEIKIDSRYYACDIMFPGIVADGIINPFDKRYRMVDGSHRMAKMKLETKYTKSYFFVITKEEFYSVLREVT